MSCEPQSRIGFARAGKRWPRTSTDRPEGARLRALPGRLPTPRRLPFLLATAMVAGGGSFPASAGVTVYSRSGQFIVHGIFPTMPTLGQLITLTNQPPLILQPDPLAVTAERVKRAILEGLAMPDRWQGKIELWIQPNTPPPTFVPVLSTHFADGWRYSVHLPEEIEPTVLTRTLAHAVLLELANRTPGPYAAEIPIWLLEGFNGQILSRTGPDAVVRPNALLGKPGDGWGELLPTTRIRREGQYLLEMRERFGVYQPLSFNDLSLPPGALLAGENLEAYRLCAQFLLEELQRLPQGRKSLAAMVGSLTRTLNWQTAFQLSFQKHFGRLLDAEQWWAVALRQFISTGTHGGWTVERTLQGLEEALRVAVEIREFEDQPPRYGVVSLRDVIGTWSERNRVPVLAAKLSQLRLVEVAAAPEAKELAQGYVRTVERYLAETTQVGAWPASRLRPPVNRKVLARQTLEQLDQLDAARVRLGQQVQAGTSPRSPAPAAPSAPGTP